MSVAHTLWSVQVRVCLSEGVHLVKIAVSGSYGAGKTTLVKCLSTKLALPYSTIPPMDSPLGRAGLTATESTRDELVELLIRRLMDRAAVEFTTARLISDGSLIHDWVFVRTLLAHGACPDEQADADVTRIIDTIEPARRAIMSRMNGLYDLMVHVPIDFEMTEGPQPVSENFRRLSDAYLINELQQLPQGYTTVSGPLQERMLFLLDAIKQSRKV